MDFRSKIPPCYSRQHLLLQELDTANHNLLQCHYAKQVWYETLQALHYETEPPNDTDTLEIWWTRQRVGFGKSKRKSLDSLIIITAWSIWKNRNAWGFNNPRQQRTVERLVTTVVDEFRLRERIGIGVPSCIRRE